MKIIQNIFEAFIATLISLLALFGILVMACKFYQTEELADRVAALEERATTTECQNAQDY